MAIAKRFALRGDTIMAITKLFELQANANAKKKKKLQTQHVSREESNPDVHITSSKYHSTNSVFKILVN